MPLYEIAIIEKPTKKQEEEGATEKLVFGPKAVVARDPQAAAIGAVSGQTTAFDLNRIEVIVRPFA